MRTDATDMYKYLLELGRAYGPALRALKTELENVEEAGAKLPKEVEDLRRAIWPFCKMYDIKGTIEDPGDGTFPSRIVIERVRVAGSDD